MLKTTFGAKLGNEASAQIDFWKKVHHNLCLMQDLMCIFMVIISATPSSTFFTSTRGALL
jgi:hypothetical protein